VNNRRRSERYRVELPVLLRDTQGGEETVTADVSAHGVAVLAPKPRALRQYVELDVILPAPLPRIHVTALVARLIDQVEVSRGRRGRGLGLDFFLFDSRAKVEWQRFIARVRMELAKREGKNKPEVPSIPIPHRVVVPDDETENVPTFLIKPRDLGRLWAFYRNELSKVLVRIETPMLKKPGDPVELLVVHPNTSGEWSLRGRVARAIERRSGRPVLEINLVGIDEATRGEFKGFVTTGQGMIEEEVHISSDLPLPIAADPPVIVPQEATELMPRSAPDSGPALPDAAAARSDSVVIDVDDEPLDLISAADEEAASISQSIEEIAASFAVDESTADMPAQEARARSMTGAVITAARAEPEGDPPPETIEAPSLRLALPELGDEESESEDVETAPPEPSLLSAPSEPERLQGRVFSSFFFEAAAARPKTRTIIGQPLSAPAATRERKTPSVELKRILATPLPLPPEPPPIEESEEDATLPPAPSQEALDAGLDRDIAVARARVVRSPNSVTAVYRLGTLLARRGAHEYSEALTTLRHVMELEPNHPGAHHAVAEVLAKRGEYNQAAEHLQRARRLGYQVDPQLERAVIEGKRTLGERPV
jgi:hypothetical protein